MAKDTKHVKCCDREKNILEIDGSYVCIQCGLVSDALCFYDDRDYRNTLSSTNTIIREFCARGEIDNQSQMFAEEMYNKWIHKFPSLDKTTLMACSIYITCKQNSVPRTMKEISSLTGCSIRQLGKYERIVSSQHFETTPTQYVDRFGSKLYLNYHQIKKIKLILQGVKFEKSFNPASIAASAIYKISVDVNIVDIENVSGVPRSTIKRICKLI